MSLTQSVDRNPTIAFSLIKHSDRSAPCPPPVAAALSEDQPVDSRRIGTDLRPGNQQWIQTVNLDLNLSQDPVTEV